MTDLSLQSIPAIVLAGGLGTRLRAVAGGMPKPLVTVAGRPFIEYVLDGVCAAGIRKAILAISYRGDLIQAHLGGSYKGASIAYSVEAEPLGTGGAIYKCFRENDLDRALVLNGDTLFRIDMRSLIQAHLERRSSMTVALLRIADASRYGTVTCDTNGYIVAFHEKQRGSSGLINGGIYVIERSALEAYDMPAKFSFESDLLQKHAAQVLPLGVEYHDYFIDIGVPEDLRRADRELAAHD